MTNQQINDLFLLGVMLTTFNQADFINDFLSNTDYQYYELINNLRKF